MKTKAILVALLSLLSVSGMAQGYNFDYSRGYSSDIKSSYHQVQLTYAHVFLTGDIYAVESLPGIALGWNSGWNITRDVVPLYLETGANILLNFRTDDDRASSAEIFYNEAKITTMRLNVPVNITYRFRIRNSKFSIAPYAGVHLTANLLGQCKYTRHAGDTSESKTLSFFNNDDMGGSEYTAKRVQFGCQAGVNFVISKFFIGFGYSGEFNKYMKSDSEKNLKTHAFVSTIGFEF